MQGQHVFSKALDRISLLRRLVAGTLGLPLMLYFVLIKYTVHLKVVNAPRRQERSIFIAWHSNNYCAIPFLTSHEFQTIFLLAHQGFASIVHTIPGRLIGVSFYHFLLSKSVSRVDQVVEFFKGRGELMIYVDSGGPYFQMKPGVTKIASLAQAQIIPVGFACNQRWIIGKKIRQILPFPFSTVTVKFAEPIDASADPQTVADVCKQSLQTLEQDLLG